MKALDSQHSRVPRLQHQPPACLASSGPIVLPLWNWGQGDLAQIAEIHSACCAVSDKVLCLRPRSLVTSVCIHETDRLTVL